MSKSSRGLSENLKKAEVLDPVEEFRRELGLDCGIRRQKKDGWFVRVIKAAHKWTFSDPAIAIAAATIAIAIAIAAAAATIVVAAAATIVVATIAIAFAAAATIVVANKNNSAGYYIFLAELAIIAIVGSALGHPVASSIPLAMDFLLYIFNGIRLANHSGTEVIHQKNAEQLVAEVFERFVAKHRPDLVSEKSSFNQKLMALGQKLTRAGEIKARLEGELRLASGERQEMVRTELEKIAKLVAELRNEMEELEKSKSEMLMALQVFEGIKGDALSYVRLRSLSEEAREVLGEASILSAQAERELEEIRHKIGQGLVRINEAVEKLGLRSLGTENLPLKALYAGAEQVADTREAREVAIKKVYEM